MAGDASRARTLLIATATRTPQQVADSAYQCHPRVDYLELSDLLHADVLDYTAYPRGRLGALIRRAETALRSDPVLALLSLARLRRYERAVCMSERVGLPLAMLRRAGLYRGRLAVLFQCWSERQAALITRLRLFEVMDIITVLSSAARDALIRLGAPRERVQLVHWGVDHRFFAPLVGVAREGFAFSLGEARHRDYPALFEAVAGLDLEVRVLARGYVDAREKHAGVTTPPPPNVTLLPFQSFTALRELYARTRFVVLALRDVSYPAGVTAVLEAMSMGCPVIAMPSRGLRDYVTDGETGILVAPNDRAGLRAAMQRLMADPGLARRLGEAGRRRVERETNQVRYVAQLAALFDGAERPRAEAAG